MLEIPDQHLTTFILRTYQERHHDGVSFLSLLSNYWKHSNPEYQQKAQTKLNYKAMMKALQKAYPPDSKT